MTDPADLSIDDHRRLLEVALQAVRLEARAMGYDLAGTAAAELLEVALIAELEPLEAAIDAGSTRPH